ncbi:NifB/NifX family molybdenum-iron cluster-binding protein [Echinimonas agarilytica]|uniref:Dinitrogenase iron-molybdenum cofactor n=1 Tax=Echinimonas agarilytica TaxID=1215918 RepID=A0AA41W7X0_9GAMM|nr:NifB/NifX family molybdenum-iron cluster-binding protein [Echinimonas agarilytica]MCM2680431.1 dinitrogenase iron-molybdenum cofactor [Echinimonas agarilytica]
MTQYAPIDESMALRLGMAAKALPELPLQQFIQCLLKALDAPLTEKKLRSLSPKSIYKILSSEYQGVEKGQANQVFAMLTSDTVQTLDGPVVKHPQLLAGKKLRLAVTSNNQELIDGHFGSCLRTLIYEINADGWHLVDVRPVDCTESGSKRTDYMVDLISDCDLLATLSIGGPAAAKVTRANIHPLKRIEPCQSDMLLKELKAVIAGDPPPWITKILDSSVNNQGLT